MSIAATKQSDKDAKPKSLSQRLGGGAGRGRPLAADDPFATFLSNAQKKAQSNRQGNNQRPQKFNRNRRDGKPAGQASQASQAGQPGQFDDAVEAPNNKKASGKYQNSASASDKKSLDNGRRRERKRNTFSGRQGQTERGPLPKASAFVSKDIDWSSFNTVSHQGVITTVTDQEMTEDERVAQRLEIQGGDYDRYLNVQGCQSAGQFNAQIVERLVGQNATYSLPEKNSFLATLSTAATGSKPVSAKK
ncbi:hypothetical protein INT43_008027 [Umbelopsis isabellina]|uniref:Uncharacterized protein n=1 Tax=Mortierella isabellina TaxID=91625 RepID=A0A8H7PP61_MORIS|nr:hypothetical protein INT43_008027 [Umbelopsis isabellina]